MNLETLIREAEDVRRFSYAPYSGSLSVRRCSLRMTLFIAAAMWKMHHLHCHSVRNELRFCSAIADGQRHLWPLPLLEGGNTRSFRILLPLWKLPSGHDGIL